MRSRGRTDIFFDELTSPLGPLYLSFTGATLVGVDFTRPHARRSSAPPAAHDQFGAYFDGLLQTFTLATGFLVGSPFERKVWASLLLVPYGETRSYKWLAEHVGNPSAMRAVGQALKKNPLPIVFPCHRIIEADGSIGGYSSGVDIKRRLLEMEYYHSLEGRHGE